MCDLGLIAAMALVIVPVTFSAGWLHSAPMPAGLLTINVQPRKQKRAFLMLHHKQRDHEF